MSSMGVSDGHSEAQADRGSISICDLMVAVAVAVGRDVLNYLVAVASLRSATYQVHSHFVSQKLHKWELSRSPCVEVAADEAVSSLSHALFSSNDLENHAHMLWDCFVNPACRGGAGGWTPS